MDMHTGAGGALADRLVEAPEFAVDLLARVGREAGGGDGSGRERPGVEHERHGAQEADLCVALRRQRRQEALMLAANVHNHIAHIIEFERNQTKTKRKQNTLE